MEGMQGWITFGGLVVSAVAQWLNRHPIVPTAIVKIALAVIGLSLYLPVEQPWVVGFGPWFEKAWVFGLALPGMASLIALAPGMATNSQGGNP